jgi:hypothetical protein
MNPKGFFLEQPANLLVGLLALVLFGAGAVALTQGQSVATIFLMLGGFVALMILEYRSVQDAE